MNSEEAEKKDHNHSRSSSVQLDSVKEPLQSLAEPEDLEDLEDSEDPEKPVEPSDPCDPDQLVIALRHLLLRHKL